MAAKTNEIQIKISSYDRTSKDINKWKQALKAAEDPDYPDRSKLMNLYHDIMLDGHLTAITEKRILNILNTPLTFQVKGKENDLVTKLIGTEAFENLLRYIVESRLYGFSLCWVDITQPGVTKPNIKLIDRRHVEPSRHIYKYKDSDSLNAGIDYNLPPLSNYVLTAGREDDLGLLLKCAPYVIYKRGDIGDWATFCEIFGMPLKVGKFPSHDTNARKELNDAMDQAGAANSITMPDTCSIDFVENKTTQSGKGVHETFADWNNNEMSKIILANTMTVDAQGGNYKGEVHQDSEDSIFEADRRFVLRILNTKGYELLGLHGYNPGDGLFSYIDEDSTPIGERITVDEKVNNIVEVDPEYYYDRYNVPRPKGGAKLKSVPTGHATSPVSQKLSDDFKPRPIKRGLFNFFD